MTRINRDDFRRRLSNEGGRLQLNDRLVSRLRSHGVDASTLHRIAGDDHVIEGPEFNALYDALALRRDADGRNVDAQVSEDLFRYLASRVEHSRLSSAPYSAPGMSSRAVGITRQRSARPATLATNAGQANLSEAADIRDRHAERPNWFERMIQAIAEWFVETFSSNEYTTSAERNEATGRDMAREHPETLRAIIAQPGGADALRDRLAAQRPDGVDEDDWHVIVDQVMAGMTAELNGEAPDLPDHVGANAPLLVRDRAAAIYAAQTDPTTRQDLGRMLDGLAASDLSESEQLQMLDAWNAADRPSAWAQQLDAFNTGMAGRSDAVRATAREALVEDPSRLAGLSQLASTPAFADAALTDTERTALIGIAAQNGDAAVRLAGVLASGAGQALPEAVQAEMLDRVASAADPDAASRALETLFGTRGFSAIPEAAQQSYVRLVTDPDVSSDAKALAVGRLAAAQSGRLAPMNDILFGTATRSQGDTGPEILLAHRYLRALGYDDNLGATESETFDVNMTAAVTDFQRRAGLLDGNPPAAQAGVLDRATMEALVDQVRAQDLDPGGYRFTTELSLNRPTRATDGPWRATQRWTPELQEEFSQFAEAYVNARIPRTPDGTRDPAWHERVDCADLSYEALIQFARQRGLPIHLRAGRTTVTHASRRPAATARSMMGAMHLRGNTTPLAYGQLPRTGDIGNMQWNQARGNGDSRYWHAHNIMSFDPLYRSSQVIFGSLEDVVKDAPLAQFNQRGFTLTIHDIQERAHIDAINDDSGQGRQLDRAGQEAAVRRLLERHAVRGHTVTQADVDAFITMIGNDANIRRDAPTEVSSGSGWGRLVDGDPWADPTARAQAVADLNRRFGASFTEADVDAIVAAGANGRAAVDAEIARVVQARVPEGSRDGATAAVADAVRGTIRWNAHLDAVVDQSALDARREAFNGRWNTSVTDADMMRIIRAGRPGQAATVAADIVERRGVPADQRAEAARELLDAASGSRRFRRWDFDRFNRHM